VSCVAEKLPRSAYVPHLKVDSIADGCGARFRNSGVDAQAELGPRGKCTRDGTIDLQTGLGPAGYNAAQSGHPNRKHRGADV
jgi:hypothetical protein